MGRGVHRAVSRDRLWGWRDASGGQASEGVGEGACRRPRWHCLLPTPPRPPPASSPPHPLPAPRRGAAADQFFLPHSPPPPPRLGPAVRRGPARALTPRRRTMHTVAPRRVRPQKGWGNAAPCRALGGTQPDGGGGGGARRTAAAVGRRHHHGQRREHRGHGLSTLGDVGGGQCGQRKYAATAPVWRRRTLPALSPRGSKKKKKDFPPAIPIFPPPTRTPPGTGSTGRRWCGDGGGGEGEGGKAGWGGVEQRPGGSLKAWRGGPPRPAPPPPFVAAAGAPRRRRAAPTATARRAGQTRGPSRR